MKNLKIKVGVAVLLLLLTTSINAGAKGKGVEIAISEVKEIPIITPVPFYIGGGPLWGRYGGCEGDCKYVDVTYGAVLRAGYEYNEYIGIEARLLGTTFAEDPKGGETFRHFGIFAKPSTPLSEDFNIYGLVGLAWTKTVTGGNHNLPIINDGGLSAGIGFEYDFSHKYDDKEDGGVYERPFDGQGDQEQGWGFFIDYQRLLIKADIPDMDVIGFGLTYDF